MPTNYKVNGVDLDQIFDPYVSGTKPAATHYTVNGVDLRDIFAPRYLGTSAPVTHYTVNGVDLNQIFAAKGSITYSLPINGNSYTRSRGRGTATLLFNMLSSGAYSITDDRGTVLDSGTWLPAGESASNYGCVFATTLVSGSDPDGGFDSYSNGAPTLSVLSTSRIFSGSASATTVGTNASNDGTVTMQLFKGGTLVSTTLVNFSCAAAGI